MRAVWFVLAVGCYANPALDSDSACKVTCTDACPSGQSCVGGYCVAPGQSCGVITGDGGTIEACAVEIALGRRHACMRKPNGTVWCSGRNERGQLGNGATGPDSSTALQVVDSAGPITDASALGAARDSTCAIRAGGNVWCWGGGDSGELGNNLYEVSPTAVQVVTSANVPLTNVVQLDGGDSFMCARDSANGVWCWGYGGLGQRGDNTTATLAYATQVLDSSYVPVANAAEISVGVQHVCMRSQDNHISCWGRSDSGQVGNGGTGDAYVATSPVTTAIGIAAGSYHTCALNADTTVTCWGDHYHERLGQPSTTDVLMPDVPVQSTVGGSAFTGATALAAGGGSCVLKGGNVLCWGDSVHGQTGSSSPVPQTILMSNGMPITNATRLVMKYSHACAYRSDGFILCWGRNSEGQFGNGTFANTSLAAPLTLTCP